METLTKLLSTRTELAVARLHLKECKLKIPYRRKDARDMAFGYYVEHLLESIQNDCDELAFRVEEYKASN